jgi:alpha-beta hydrolase superfamily lysophospholipase
MSESSIADAGHHGRPPHPEVTVSDRDTAWLAASTGPILAWLHHGMPQAPVGVLIVPPFGWDNMASYSPRRRWAEELAATGVPVVRFDLPATGDSAGEPSMDGLVGGWVDGVGTAAAWLRERSGCAAVLALALSAGGLLALKAAADGSPIDHFALWATQSSGAGFIRETTVFSRLEAARLAPADRDEIRGTVPEGAIMAGGYLFSAQTLDDLKALDSQTMALPEPERRSALLLGRGRDPDPRLRAALTAQGVAVTVSRGHGYEDLLVEPQFARLPAAAAQDVAGFIASLAVNGPGTRPATPARPAEPPASVALITLGDGVQVRETVLTIDHAGEALVGTLTDPLDDGGPLAAILIGGTGHRMGPNRMWTELGRRWAARGVPTLRVDITGAGDAETTMPSETAPLYTLTDIVEQTQDVVDALRERTGRQRILLVGLCAGGFWAVQVAMRDPDVVPVALNLPLLVWNELESAQRIGRIYRAKLMQGRTLARIVRGEVDFASGIRRIPAVLGLRVSRGDGGTLPAMTPIEVLDALAAREQSSWFVFAGEESLGEDMQPGGPLDATSRPRLHMEVFGPRSDLHTLRPLWVQRELFARLDRALESELAFLSP